jgi:hypothetical protein
MNLIQIQDKLKSLPNDPRVMQLLTGYANGQNPQVPPYLALGELNRRKVEAERAQMEQAGQPPGGTVKDQIEQQAGVMALKQAQQQQGMQRMAQQGMQAQAPQVMAAASGGLASLRPGYRSGGIIAFQKAGSVDDAVEAEENNAAEEGGSDGEESTGAYSGDARAVLTQLMQEAAKRRGMQAPTAETPLEARKRMIEADPERYAALNKPIGEDALARLQELQDAKRAEFATQKEELAKSKPGILQLLGQAAMGSRGQKGGSALASILGGYSELSSGADAKQLQQEQALRMKELDLQQARAEAMTKVDDLRRAKLEGDIAGEQKAKMDLARIAKDHNVSLNTLLGKQLSTASQVVESERKGKDAALKREADLSTANLNREQQAQLARERIRAQLNIAFRPGEKERILQQIAKLRKDGKTEEADALLKDIRDMQGGASDVGRAKNDRVVITELLRSRRRDLQDAESPEEEGAIRAEIAELNEQLKGLAPKSDKVKPVAVPQSMPSGVTKANASKLLKVGTVYETAAGPGKWNGTSFDSVK